MPKRASGPATVYQLKITLKDVKPPVWRRIQVENCSLARLHGVIQACMGWSNCHLYAFELDGEEYGDDPDLLDARSLKLGRIARDGPSRFTYQYDFGDDWRHVVTIEKVLPAEPGTSYPRCIDGKRACPPEDCGGAYGYENLLETVRNASHPEYEQMLEWVGGSFDPDAFDIEGANRRLR
jgi:hypothetical protein